jgi:two-component system, cell cycle sensor histidine kinase and response regulator CckA
LIHKFHYHENLSEGNYLFLRVADTGTAMTDEVKNHLFEPFFTTKFTGRGLGLSSVLGITKSHQGGICLDDNQPHGSIFTVFFPLGEKP